jgi:hypothetical protein
MFDLPKPSGSLPVLWNRDAKLELSPIRNRDAFELLAKDTEKLTDVMKIQSQQITTCPEKSW